MKQQTMRDMYKLGLGEEIANCVTHGVMAFLCLCSLPVAAVFSYETSGLVKSVAISIFILCLFLMFLVSTLYHCMPFGTNHKYVFRKLDHICIYFAIAGSYTPVALCLIEGWLGILVLIIEWGAVLGGILLKSIAIRSFPKLSMAIYMIMGWTALLFIPTLIQNSTPLFLVLVVGGGIMYTIGAFFYSHPDKRYFHSIWHVFINLASILHFIAFVFAM